ncbi:MAG: His Kinase A [bacterium]|nr:MAG: His Kinase A [bacterium]
MWLAQYLVVKLNTSKLYLLRLGKAWWVQNICFILLALLTVGFPIGYFFNTLADTTSSSLTLNDTKGEYPLGTYLSILEDKNKNLTIEEIASDKFAAQFVVNKTSSLNFGYSKSAYWIKFSLNNKSNKEQNWLLEIDFPRLNQVDLYQANTIKNSSTTFTKKTIGSSTPFIKREFAHRSLVFPLVLLLEEEKVFYLRVESFSTISIPAMIWNPEAFQQKDQVKLLFLGTYYGILLVLVVYNIFLYFAIGDRVFLLYVIRAMVLGMLQCSFDGFAAQYLWPQSDFLTNHSIQFFGSLFGTSVALLAREYLYLKEKGPLWDKIAKCFAIVFAIFAIFAIFSYNRFVPPFVNILGLILAVVLIVPTIISLRKNDPSAKFFLVSILAGLTGGIITIMRNLDIIDNTFFAHYSLHFGSALQVIVLSLGLADRVRILQKDKEQAELTATLKEKDSEIFRLRNAELTEVNLKLKELDQIKANFTAMLVHDLKSPLAVVRAALELLADDKTINRDNQQMISASEHSVNKILSLVNEVLDLYRSESQVMELEPKSIDVEIFMRDFTSTARLSALANNITVDVQMTLPLPEIMGDISKLERVFSNLISNAIKFTTSGGKITIEVSSVAGTGVEVGLTFLRVSITDTGEGIVAEAIPYLFEPYRQAESRKKAAGVGLGLAIVKRIVASHGGNISVRSQLGVGSCFTVMLPAISASETVISPNKKMATFTKSGRLVPYIETESQKNEEVIFDNSFETTPPLSNMLSAKVTSVSDIPIILLVDDDNMNQLIVKRQLQQLGYKVDVAANGVAALRTLKNKAYSLILMDCNMPIMDGYEATMEIRRREAKERQKGTGFSRIPIIALTANSLDDSENCFEVGMDDFLEKPFQMSQIKNILEKWLIKS